MRVPCSRFLCGTFSLHDNEERLLNPHTYSTSGANMRYSIYNTPVMIHSGRYAYRRFQRPGRRLIERTINWWMKDFLRDMNEYGGLTERMVYIWSFLRVLLIHCRTTWTAFESPKISLTIIHRTPIRTIFEEMRSSHSHRLLPKDTPSGVCCSVSSRKQMEFVGSRRISWSPTQGQSSRPNRYPIVIAIPSRTSLLGWSLSVFPTGCDSLIGYERRYRLCSWDMNRRINCQIPHGVFC